MKKNKASFFHYLAFSDIQVHHCFKAPTIPDISKQSMFTLTDCVLSFIVKNNRLKWSQFFSRWSKVAVFALHVHLILTLFHHLLPTNSSSNAKAYPYPLTLTNLQEPASVTMHDKLSLATTAQCCVHLYLSWRWWSSLYPQRSAHQTGLDEGGWCSSLISAVQYNPELEPEGGDHGRPQMRGRCKQYLKEQ